MLWNATFDAYYSDASSRRNSCMFVFVLVSKRYKVYKEHQSIETCALLSSHAGSVPLAIISNRKCGKHITTVTMKFATVGLLCELPTCTNEKSIPAIDGGLAQS